MEIFGLFLIFFFLHVGMHHARRGFFWKENFMLGKPPPFQIVSETYGDEKP
jgi:hypothetical protein